ncbi:MAG: TAXI family TRAP transporter solute-binding subunit [Myxococcota bacterium]|nr:TAXI family TRAP transporter solute-binding subunit [Myxococcota bacterium]
MRSSPFPPLPRVGLIALFSITLLSSAALSRPSGRGAKPLGEQSDSSAYRAAPTGPRLRICTGNRNGYYFQAGQQIAEVASGNLDINVLETRGSWENLSRAGAEQRSCDALIAQEDAYRLYLKENPSIRLEIEAIISLYPEQIHVLCNRAVDAERLSELEPGRHRLLTARYGSGTYITWTFFKHMAPRYRALQILEEDSANAFSALVSGTSAQCMLSVGALARGVVAQANDDYGDQLKLLEIDDPEFLKAVGRPGEQRQLYQQSYIHKNSYPRLQDRHLSGYQVRAILFLSNEWRTTHSWEAESLIQTLERERERFRRSID